MILHDLMYSGFFEEQPAMTSERLQLVVPENDLDVDFLSWVILPHPESVQDDFSRRDYIFRYELGDYLQNGIYVLRILARDASRIRHQAEIAAGIAATLNTAEPRALGFVPLWFISERLHFRPQEGYEFDRPAYGHLRFGGVGNLPHRRLFGATVR